MIRLYNCTAPDMPGKTHSTASSIVVDINEGTTPGPRGRHGHATAAQVVLSLPVAV